MENNMNNKNFFIMIILSTLLSCGHYPQENYKTVDSVDLERYVGKWYVIENIPTMFEKDAFNAVEEYSLIKNKEGENEIAINFYYNKSSFDGEKKSYPQKGLIFNDNSKAHWKIKIPWIPVTFDYLILDIAPDYKWTVVGVPSQNYVWIMSREKNLDQEIVNELKNKLKERGYDITKMQVVPQN